jgi:long-chain acyl-CoA synthetase
MLPAGGLEAAAAQGLAMAWHAGRAPGRLAILSDLGTRTFAELDARANRLVRALRRRGLAAGDALALLLPNRPEFAEAVCAGYRAGLRVTPVNWHLTGPEAGYIVDDAEARALVADARLAGTAGHAAALAPRAAVRLAVGGPIPGFEPYDAALAAEPADAIPAPVLGRLMLYTSGTTGHPKGVDRAAGPSLTLRATTASAAYQPGEDLHLCTGPLYHAAPLGLSLVGPLHAGVGVVLMDGWDAERTLALIATHRVTHSHLVPTMFHRLLALPEAVRRRHDLASLRWVAHGAAPCPVTVKRAMIAWWGPILWEYYGATEGGGTLVDSATWLARPGTVGRPIPGAALEIRSEAGAVLPAGEAGTVWIRMPEANRFRYHGDDARTAQAWRGDWFTLGDVGRLDADGYLYLTDRSADLVISGGVNIYPAEVDAVLLAHPAVADAAAIGVPEPEWGEAVLAVVELRPGHGATPALAAELVAHCRAHLAHYKCPRRVEFTDRLPRHETGKVAKRLLRDLYRRRSTRP